MHPAKSADRAGCADSVPPPILDESGAGLRADPEGTAMPISNIPIFSMLRTKMQWHQERQRLLAENVANSDTPKFMPRDLTPLKFDPSRQEVAVPTLARTNAAHIAAAAGSDPRFGLDRHREFESRPSGNAVSLEDEMLKVSSNAMDYQAATALYTRGLGLIKSALGRR
jgi:flagellar basal-body rod protein FlgB